MIQRGAIRFITGEPCNSALKRPETNLFPTTTCKGHEIVSMVEHDGTIFVATKQRIYKLISDEFKELKLQGI